MDKQDWIKLTLTLIDLALQGGAAAIIAKDASDRIKQIQDEDRDPTDDEIADIGNDVDVQVSELRALAG